jgi:hypothetical protein
MHSHIGKFIAAAAAAVAVLGGGATALAANAGTVRPHVAASTSSSTLTPLVQEFSADTSPFCPAGSGNVPCDGAEGHYGTITRTAYTTGGIPALAAGEPAYALTAGTQATSSGCPATQAQENAAGDEYCTGPYALFGDGTLAAFPATGFTVTADLYLTPSEPGDISADVGLNNSDGAYGDDNIISFCPVTGGGLAVSIGGVDSCDGATTAQITKAGWYRAVWDFTPDAGDVALNENVTSEATGYAVWQGELDAPVYLNGSTTQATVASAGGPNYFWIPVENTDSLPLSNFAVQLGSYPGGSAPDQVNVTNPGAQASTVGKAVNLQVQASASSDTALTYTATGLPAGLNINSATGLITGTPTAAQSTGNATVTATDAVGDSGSATFGWTVTAAPPASTKLTAEYVCGRSQSHVEWKISNVDGAGAAIANLTARYNGRWNFLGSKSISLHSSYRLTTHDGKQIKVYYDANGSRPAKHEAGALSVTASAPLNKRCG